ncbi:MAG: acetamidase/formamidase family protein [Candidatus Poribacteria bacterium]|nr:acetamidase/formamidase family protein [Candidatus Poribacteria bacterium]
MKRATRDILYFETGPDNKPTMRVSPGETFEVETQLNRGPWLDNHPDGERLREKLYGGNPSSGCYWVEGAKPGDALRVKIGDIALDPVGFTRYGGNTGAFPGWLGMSGVGEAENIVEIRDNVIHWGDGKTLPARPMIGFVGVSPARERHHNGWGGNWGGNFDVQEITTGADVILPVEVDGALLHIGDMHAIQGDGEICGAGGIEASGTVRVSVEIISPRPKAMMGPRIENRTHIGTVAMARPAEDAFRQSLAALILWLEADYGFTKKDAYLWLGQVLEARVTQFVNPTFTYIAKINRNFLPPQRG